MTVEKNNSSLQNISYKLNKEFSTDGVTLSEKNNIKQLLRPITTGANSAMNRSEKQSEKSRVQEVIG